MASKLTHTQLCDLHKQLAEYHQEQAGMAILDSVGEAHRQTAALLQEWAEQFASKLKELAIAKR